MQIQTGTNINLLFFMALLKTLMLNMDEGDITCYYYIVEVERQLHNETYYEKLDVEFSDTVEKNVLNCISEISDQNESIVKEFDALADNIRIP